MSIPMLPRSPYINGLGQITDPVSHARWTMEQRAGQHQPPAVPCDSPHERGGSHFTPVCICGHDMAAHRVGVEMRIAAE